MLQLFPSGFLLASGDTLAVVAGQPITSEEFINRFELSIYPCKDKSVDLDSLKQKFLASMVAERLLSLDANGGGEEINAELDRILRQSEELFLRDALYRREVLSHVSVSQTEIRNGVKQGVYYYIVDAFYFPDTSTALRFLGLAKSLPERQFYRFADSVHVSHDTLQIRYGESTEAIERAFFGRYPGFLSPPTLTEDGEVVFRVLQKEIDTEFGASPPEEQAERIRRLIRNRTSDEKGFEYLGSVMKNVRVQVNYDLFRPLASQLGAFLQRHNPTPDDPHYHLTPADIASMRERFGARESEAMLTWRGGGLSLQRVLDELPMAGFTAADTSLGEVTSGLHAALRFITQNYFLAQRARKLGLQNSSEVRYNVQLFSDAFLSAKEAEIIRQGVTVSEPEVDSFYNRHRDLVLESVMLKLKKYDAKTLDEAATLYNRLLSERSRGSALGDTAGFWISAAELGETGAAIALLNPGEIYGPVRGQGNYLWYKLLAKRSPVSREGLERSLRVARERLLEEKRRAVLNKHIAQIAENSSVQIYEDRLRRVDVTPTQMFTVRYIGFGGKIVAVPPLYPREEWIQYLQNKRKIFP